MDSGCNVSNHACTTAETSSDKTLDLLHHRSQRGQQAQEEVFLGQSTPYLEAAREVIQVAGVLPRHTLDDIYGWSDVQMMASWVDFWDEEGFYYCHLPGNVCSLESSSSTESVTSFRFGGEEFDVEVLPESTQSDEEYSILSLGPSYSSLPSRLVIESPPSPTYNLAMPPPQATISDTSRTSRIIDPEDPNEGEDLDLPDSDRPGLRPQDFGFLPPGHVRPRSPIPVTRAETITITLGNWEHQITVIKPNADYRDVPSPIMQPGSPPQRPRKPSLGGFYKLPSRRNSGDTHHDGLGILGSSSRVNNNEQPLSPPSPGLKIPERALSFMNHPSNSDVSVFDLGSPTQPLSDDEKQQQFRSALRDSALSSPPPRSRGRVTVTPASGPSTMQLSSTHVNTARLQSRRHLRQNQGIGIRPPVILSVQVPQGNDVSWSAPVSPESKKQPSPGVVFELDEELKCS